MQHGACISQLSSCSSKYRVFKKGICQRDLTTEIRKQYEQKQSWQNTEMFLMFCTLVGLVERLFVCVSGSKICRRAEWLVGFFFFLRFGYLHVVQAYNAAE